MSLQQQHNFAGSKLFFMDPKQELNLARINSVSDRDLDGSWFFFADPDTGFKSTDPSN